MANLKDLIVSGTSRFVGKIYGLITRAEADEDGLNLKGGYSRKGKVLTINDSNLSTYYNSTTQTLTIPEGIKIVRYESSTSITLKYIKTTAGDFEDFDKLGFFFRYHELNAGRITISTNSTSTESGVGRIKCYSYTYSSSSDRTFSVDADGLYSMIYVEGDWYCSYGTSYIATY